MLLITECRRKLDTLVKDNKFSKDMGKKVFKLVRILPTLLEILRNSLSKEEYAQYASGKELGL